MAKHGDKPKGKPATPPAKPKAAPKVKGKAIPPTPMPKRGDPQIGAKRKTEARSAAIGRGLMKQM